MKNRFLKTASLLTAISIAERGLGFLYRILLSRLIGEEGIGLYQVALSLFSLFLTIGTGGLPVTVSRIITKHRANGDLKGEESVTCAGILLSILLTLPITLFFYFFGEKTTFLFSDERTYPLFRILLLGLTISSLYAVIRGWFWGRKQLLLPSVIELVEESIKVLIGVLLLRSVLSPLDGAKKAAWAIVLSALCAFLVSLCCFFFAKGRFASPKNRLKPLFNATLPITSVRMGSSLVNSAIAVLLPAMLVRSGLDEGQALRVFGVVSGMVLPVLFIPATLIGSISLVLIPELSEDYYKRNYRRLIQNARRGLYAVLLIACALLPFFYTFGKSFGSIAFASPLAGEIIQKSCVLLFPMSLSMMATGMLNSLGFEKYTFVFYFIGAASLLLCILFLPSFCGVYAYIIGLIVQFSVNALLSLSLLQKKCRIFPKRSRQVFDKSIFFLFLLPLFLSVFGQLLLNVCKCFFGELLAVCVAAVLLAAITFLLYILTGLFDRKRLSPLVKS